MKCDVLSKTNIKPFNYEKINVAILSQYLHNV